MKNCQNVIKNLPYTTKNRLELPKWQDFAKSGADVININ